mmetsp:Transcript_23711/g.70582  ORF Transcript_23711/g.70582 Transcript_23711/m.70582 type:complete len:567 (+) Transcript_23711:211-1911(+)
MGLVRADESAVRAHAHLHAGGHVQDVRDGIAHWHRLQLPPELFLASSLRPQRSLALLQAVHAEEGLLRVHSLLAELLQSAHALLQLLELHGHALKLVVLHDALADRCVFALVLDGSRHPGIRHGPLLRQPRACRAPAARAPPARHPGGETRPAAADADEVALLRGLFDELAQVGDVLDRGEVVGAEIGHHLQELVEVQLPVHKVAVRIELREDEVRVVHQIGEVHVHRLQRGHRGLVVQDAQELLLGDHVVPIKVDLVLDDGVHHGLDVVVVHPVLLVAGHAVGDLTQDADQHVRDRQRRDDDEEHEDHGELPPGLTHEVQQVSLVGEDAGDCERQHRHGHRVEVGLPEGDARLTQGGLRHELHEHEGEDVDHYRQEHQGGADGAGRRADAADQHHQLRHRAHQAGHAREPQQPYQPEGRQLAQGAFSSVQEGQDEWQHQVLEDHHDHQSAVEDEPRIPEGHVLVLEGCPADAQLHDEEGHERELHQQKLWSGFKEGERFVVVNVDPDPDSVEDDHIQRQGLEVHALSDSRAEPVLELLGHEAAGLADGAGIGAFLLLNLLRAVIA